MPRIPDHFLDSSFYLYDSVRSAQDGEKSGGSGFLAHVPSVNDGWIHLYAVTNKHLVDNGFHVLRLNTVEGKIDTIQSRPESWFLHPDGDDVAILPLEVEGKQLKWFSIGTNRFITPDIIANYHVGPGDEAFLIGRLVSAEGRQRNRPVARFGNISMMADSAEPVRHPSGIDQESFLVECRSLSGFSGSPVFATTSQFYDSNRLPKISESGEPIPDRKTSESSEGIKAECIGLQGTFGPWLLGINWGHVPLRKPVYEKGCLTECYVEANTGIACVAPAWRIMDVLNQRELVKSRKRDDDEIAQRNQDTVTSGIRTTSSDCSE